MNNMDNYLDEQNINKNPNGNLEKLYNKNNKEIKIKNFWMNKMNLKIKILFPTMV